jgi:hypothetical protein
MQFMKLLRLSNKKYFTGVIIWPLGSHPGEIKLLYGIIDVSYDPWSAVASPPRGTAQVLK